MDPRIFAFFATIIFVTSVGFALGYFVKAILIYRSKNNLEERLSRMRIDAQDEVALLKKKTNAEIDAQRTSLQQEVIATKKELHQQQERLTKREDSLERREEKNQQLSMSLEQNQAQLEHERKEVRTLKEQRTKELETIAGLSHGQARDQLVKELEESETEALFALASAKESNIQEAIEEKGKELTVLAMQRYANKVDNDMLSSAVTLESDDAKGKIIGKEGRNIKSFEQLSGVQLLIDDTPGQVTISSFDPIRRAIAKTALDELLKDGRIQPVRIEEELESAREKINETIVQRGRQAAKEVGVYDLDPELLRILGTLYYRYSFGQNVLQHSVEMAHIAGVLASELEADIYVAKAAALMHDIGKAVDHEVEGTHVEIGKTILKQYGVDENIIIAMQAHHEEYPYESIEARIVQAADSISSARPGARSDNAGLYIERLEGLEKIASSFEGVQDAFAVSAGREVRVFVNPEVLNDFQANKLARKIVKRVQQELKYPGEIKVTVIRENRTIEIAR